MTTPRTPSSIAAAVSLLLAAMGCGPNAGQEDSTHTTGAADVGSSTEALDTSFLPKQFRINWAPGIPGGVPRDNDAVRPASVWLPAGNPYGGYSVNPALAGQGNAAAFTSAMQAAINAAGAAATPSSRKIVLLKAGTYFVNPQNLPNKGGRVGLYVTVDNVTIRGEGADRTRLAANGTIPEYGTVVLFGHRGGFSDADFNVTSVTGNAWMGTTTVPVADASRFAVGDIITIDCVDGPAKQVGNVMMNGDYIWFYDAQYFKRQPGFSWIGPSTGAGNVNVSNLSSANAAANNVVPNWRSLMQTNEIVAISGNTLILKDQLNVDFFSWRSPQVWRVVAKDNKSIFLGNRWSGIENIAVAGGNNQWGFPGGSIAFSFMSYAWAKNVEADGSRSDAAHPGKDGYNIGLGRCYRCEVRDSYVHDSRDENPGGQAYGIVIGTGTSASLVENNISINNNKPITLVSQGGGNVIAYNYVDNAVIWGSPGWQENAIDDSHGAFTHNDLIEGNWTPNIGSATTHGNSAWHVHYRNYATGRNSAGNVNGNLRAVGVDAWTHDSAFVGNVLKGGNVYETNPSSQGGTPIYQLGNNFIAGGWDNGYAKAHIWRDGNWDSVNGRTVWASGAKTLPPSLYLNSKPAFFGSRTWPWVDPLTGTVGTLPAKARYDSGTPNVVP